ncbi:hypothetical protein ASE16_02400 [Leifsonia sp. Root227]|nr:hypothetical protein ASE16_02400 [Leifsonia sp. Root227]
MIVGRHVEESVHHAELAGKVLSAFRCSEDRFCAVTPDGSQLGFDDVIRQNDDRRDPRPLSGAGDAKPVVAAGSGDDPVLRD